MNWINHYVDVLLDRLAPTGTAEALCMAGCGGELYCFFSPCGSTYQAAYRHCTSGQCTEYWQFVRCGC